MIERIIGRVPDWMQLSHPVMRSQTPRGEKTRRSWLLRAVNVGLVLFIIGLIGYGVVSEAFTRNPFDLPISQMLIEWLSVPIFGLQVVMYVIVMMTTVALIGAQERRRVWDSIRVTTDGADLSLRTHWSYLLFHRLRGLLTLAIAARLVLIGAMLYDLTAFQGEYLRNLTGGIVPNVPLPVSVILLAAAMAASLILPFTALGLNAAFGLLLATFVRNRTYITLMQATVIAIRVAIATTLFIGFSQFAANPFDVSPTILAWLLIFAFAAFGDWGLGLLYLGFFGFVWREIPYSILIGPALLIYALAQSVLTDLILSWAVRRAETME